MQNVNDPPTGHAMEPQPGHRRTATPAVIDLAGATWLGQGNGRACYVHPLDAALVIKIRRQDRRTRDQNTLEGLYLSSLARRRVPFDHIPRLHGVVATTLGEGLVYERIVDADGRQTLSLTDTVRQGLLTLERATVELEHLRTYLFRHWIAFVDTGGAIWCGNGGATARAGWS